MRHKREGLLAQIEAGVLDDSVPLSSLLQKCIVLGGQSGSEKMRAWARQELHGYDGAPHSLPDYRRIPASMNVQITNRAGYNGITQRIYKTNLPSQFNEIYDVEEAALTNGIGELVAIARSGKAEHHMSPGWSSFLVGLLNEFNVDGSSRVVGAYWSVSNVAIEGLLERVRTTLAELVAELSALTPEDQAVPDTSAADAAVHVVITGDRNTINYSSQQATNGSTNTVTVSGEHGTAIGSQTADGANSSVVGRQTVQGDHNAVAGREATHYDAKERPAKEGWWARLRKRGVLVAIFTVVAGVVAVFTWIGWIPWN